MNNLDNFDEKKSVINLKDDDVVSVKSNVLSIVSGFDSVVNEWEALQRLEMI